MDELFEEDRGLMDGKVCLVTGASRGIGLHIALGLASMGAFVVLAGHNQARGENARRHVDAFALRDCADFILVDLSSQEQIHRFTETVKQKYDHLDVLVNNAGGFFLKREESLDGIEMTFALNHLNYFMTTMLLMDSLLRSESPRIVNVASESHRSETMHFTDLQLMDAYNAMRAYGQSKLANLLFTYELSRRLLDTDVTVNALHPGFVNTYLGKQDKLVRPFMNMIHFLFAKSPKAGAETPIYLASSPDVTDITGQYFIDKNPVQSSYESHDLEEAFRLWKVSEELCNLEVARFRPGYLKELPTHLNKSW